jgi:hypothetical protein
MSDERTRLFSADFDDEFAIGAEPGNAAFFGQNVLRGLVEGIDDFKATRQQRWRRWRSYGAALLACARWLDDEELLSKLADLAGACVVLTKQGRSKHDLTKLERLKRANVDTAGLPIKAFPELGGWAPKVDGQPLVVGPYGPPMDEAVIPAIRTIGYRKAGRGDLPPLMHAKLALLGHLWWDDVGPHGHIEDVIGFTGQRLWISSANFTASSRRSLEGILVLGHQEHDPDVARDLGLPVPRKGQFVSARIVPAEPGTRAPTAEIEGESWRIANEDDAVVPAPLMPRVSRRGTED